MNNLKSYSSDSDPKEGLKKCLFTPNNGCISDLCMFGISEFLMLSFWKVQSKVKGICMTLGHLHQSQDKN